MTFIIVCVAITAPAGFAWRWLISRVVRFEPSAAEALLYVAAGAAGAAVLALWTFTGGCAGAALYVLWCLWRRRTYRRRRAGWRPVLIVTAPEGRADR